VKQEDNDKRAFFWGKGELDLRLTIRPYRRGGVHWEERAEYPVGGWNISLKTTNRRKYGGETLLQKPGSESSLEDHKRLKRLNTEHKESRTVLGRGGTGAGEWGKRRQLLEPKVQAETSPRSEAKKRQSKTRNYHRTNQHLRTESKKSK